MRPTLARFRTADPTWIGFGLAIFSAAVYTAANVCLRDVAHCDPFLVSWIKCMPMVLFSAGMIAYGRARHACPVPGVRILAALVLTGIIAQLGGNVGYQVALGNVGLALGTALNFGVLIVGGAVVGWFWLREPVSARSTVAMALLVGAIALLCLAAPAAAISVATTKTAGVMLLGVGGACASGIAYCVLAAIIRQMSRDKIPLFIILFMISATGFVGHGLFTFYRVGWDGLEATPWEAWRSMIAAGLFNSIAFVALSNALRRAPVVQVNAVNASQIAMAAMAGVIFFDEPASWPLVVGTLLTVVGLWIVDRSPTAEEPDAAVAASLIASEAGD